MAKSPFTRRDEERELTRRALIKWTLACGVGFGVSRSKVHEILEKHAGKGIAEAAATLQFTRYLGCSEGGGGLANWTQIIPFFEVARAKNPAFSWVGAADAAGAAIAGTDLPLWGYTGNPFAKLAPKNQVSAFLCGSNNTHNQDGNTSTNGLGGKSIHAFAAELQVTALSSVIPALSIGANVGPSAVPFSSANNIAGAVNLFDSVASRAGGLLAVTNQADLFTAHYNILASLNKVAKNPIQANAYRTANGAAKFLGKNLAAELQVTPADLAAYGATGASNGATRYAQAMIFAVKAFKLGLTNNIVFDGYQNDPHGFFDQGDFQTEPQVFRRILASFMDQMEATLDPVTGTPLSSNLTMVVQGDTYKNAFNRGGWGDGTTANSNVVYMYTSGHVKSGWHGGLNANNTAYSLNGAGAQVAYDGAEGARAALASAAYSVAKRQSREIQSFANFDFKVHVNDLEL